MYTAGGAQFARMGVQVMRQRQGGRRRHPIGASWLGISLWPIRHLPLTIPYAVASVSRRYAAAA